MTISMQMDEGTKAIDLILTVAGGIEDDRVTEISNEQKGQRELLRC